MGRLLQAVIGLMVFVPCLRAQVSVQVIPDNGANPDPTNRLTNTSGHTVQFTLVNNGTVDTRYAVSCSGGGPITGVTCTPTSPLIAAGDSRVVTATFGTTYAGTGPVHLTVTSTQPTGASGAGKWDVTVVNPSVAVTPDGTTLPVAPGTVGVTQAFTVSNTATAATAYAMSVACTGTGAASCSVAPASISLNPMGQAGSSASVTAMFNAGSAGTTGSLTVSASFGGNVVDNGYVTVVIPNASVAPDAQPVTAPANTTGLTYNFTVTNTGAAAATFPIAVACSGAGVSGCVVSPSSLTLNPSPGTGSSGTVQVTYNSGAGGSSGTVTVQASFGGTVLDVGSLDVTVPASVPVVTVTPDGGAPLVLAPNAAATTSFTVEHSGTVPSTYNLTAICTAPAATGCPGSLSPLTFNAPGAQNVTVNFTAGTAGAATGKVTLTATHAAQATVKDSGWTDMRVVAASVTPDNQPLGVAPNTSGLTFGFNVQNTGPVTATFALAVACTGAGVTGCSVSPASSALGPGASATATVTYSSGPSGSVGVVVLEARYGGALLDTGSLNVTVQSLSAPVVSVAANPGDVLARDQCLTVAVASAAASDCGDLRIIHPLPAVRVMNTWRTPTLVYNSAHARGWVSVGADVTLPAGSQVPTSVSAALRVGGVTYASGNWAGADWSPGASRRIALGFEGLATGVHDYALDVTNTFGGTPLTTTVTGQLAVVNRGGSEFGTGWWLGGLEQLNPTTMVWVGGDVVDVIRGQLTL